jgi:hypothetical protein
VKDKIKKPTAVELVEVLISEPWVTLIVACQGKAKCELRVTIINGQPTEYEFGPEKHRADITPPLYTVIRFPDTPVEADGAIEEKVLTNRK